jgi:hypothetical protein
VAAALGTQVSWEQYGSEIAQPHGVTCRFRVGLDTGPVVGTVTDDQQMNFRAGQVRRVKFGHVKFGGLDRDQNVTTSLGKG